MKLKYSEYLSLILNCVANSGIALLESRNSNKQPINCRIGQIIKKFKYWKKIY